MALCSVAEGVAVGVDYLLLHAEGLVYTPLLISRQPEGSLGRSLCNTASLFVFLQRPVSAPP